jgi:hypothetical protein
MGANVFANGMEISGKASDNKSIAAMPDVCMSPPSPPAGPVPIPYPNTAMASDTADGTKTVKIGGKEAGMKNASTYSKSTGDEPATQSFGANVGSHKIQGAMKFSAWSSDVKLEGANAIRMGDMTTHNHANPQGVSPVTASVAKVNVESPPTCAELEEANDNTRAAMKSRRGKGTKGIRKIGMETSTITHGVFSSGPMTLGMKACSRILPKRFNPGVWAKGKGAKSTIICGEKHKYPTRYRPVSSHTESRILVDIMSKFPGGNATGSLLLAINVNKQAGPSPDPCPDCQEMLCKAAKCLTITLCVDKNPKPLECK